MSPLEQAIKEAASPGRPYPLTGLTLWPSQGQWQASARYASSEGWNVAIHEDPVQALIGALGGKPKQPLTIEATPNAGVFD